MAVPQYLIEKRAREFDKIVEMAREHRNFHVFGPRHGYNPEGCPICHERAMHPSKYSK